MDLECKKMTSESTNYTFQPRLILESCNFITPGLLNHCEACRVIIAPVVTLLVAPLGK